MNEEKDIKSPSVFYVETLELFNKIASKSGLSEDSTTLIPEIFSEGEKFVLKWLKDEKFQLQFGNDATNYYYNIANYAFFGGMYYAYVWHTDAPRIKKEDIYQYLYKNGVIETSRKIISIDEKTINGLFQEMFECFFQRIQPYHKSMNDYRAYIYQGMLTFFQTGKNVQLKSMGYR